jgi:glycine hydroxymethyltransferase
VLAALGSTLTNKYADGYPGRRQYSGCEAVDVAETLAIERAKQLFGAAYANVQPYSGTQANAAVYLALLEPGDCILGMRASHGGHITHGDAMSFSGRQLEAVHYGVDAATGEIDYDEVEALARAHRPKLVVAGFSAYSRVLDWARFRAIADAVGARLLVDMAHVAGLVAAGLYPNPVPVADVVTSTTHKTLRGPRGGLIVAREAGDLAARLDAGVYPGTQGGPLMHVVAAKAVAFKEALEPEFRLYQQRVIANAKCMANVLAERGCAVRTGGTDDHMIIVDLGPGGLDAAEAQAALEHARIAVNWIDLPPGRTERGGDPASAAGPPSGARGRAPMTGGAVPSPSGSAGRGLRLGTPAITTRGIREADAERIAHWVVDVLAAPSSGAVRRRVRAEVAALTRRYPVYPSYPSSPRTRHRDALPVL